MNTLSLALAIIGSVALTTGSIYHNPYLLYTASFCILGVGLIFQFK